LQDIQQGRHSSRGLTDNALLALCKRGGARRVMRTTMPHLRAVAVYYMHQLSKTVNAVMRTQKRRRVEDCDVLYALNRLGQAWYSDRVKPCLSHADSARPPVL
jgi:histone H3/H4